MVSNSISGNRLALALGRTTLRSREQELAEMMYDIGVGHLSVFRPESVVYQRSPLDGELTMIPSARTQTL